MVAAKFKEFFGKNAMLVVLLLVMMLFEFMISGSGRGSLFSAPNLTNIISQNGYVVILATGMLLCILTGGNIDLSVGSIVILVASVSGIMIVDHGMNSYLTIAVCLAAATLIGAWQAFWIAYMKIPPFVTTLAGMLMFRGLALWIMDSKGKGPYPDNFKELFNSFIPGRVSLFGTDVNFSFIIALIICVVMVAVQLWARSNKKKKGYDTEQLWWLILRLAVVSAAILFVFFRFGEYSGIQYLLLWLAAIVLIYSYFTQNTIPGRYLYAIGGNEKAARLSGVNTSRMMFFAYTNMGFLSGIAAMVCVARQDQASTQLGTSFELDAIGACFIGGASAYGGVGKVGGAVIGAIFMGVLNMGMSIMGIDMNLQRVFKGLLLLCAVVFDIMSKKRKQAA
ncbi:MAG: sugar ABC transporter permease [Lachnospiraceae bacterium]|nr:sugar ABC transporter permease [Lachnospiraceae bacterium]